LIYFVVVPFKSEKKFHAEVVENNCEWHTGYRKQNHYLWLELTIAKNKTTDQEVNQCPVAFLKTQKN